MWVWRKSNVLLMNPENSAFSSLATRTVRHQVDLNILLPLLSTLGKQHTVSLEGKGSLPHGPKSTSPSLCGRQHQVQHGGVCGLWEMQRNSSIRSSELQHRLVTICSMAIHASLAVQASLRFILSSRSILEMNWSNTLSVCSSGPAGSCPQRPSSSSPSRTHTRCGFLWFRSCQSH